MRVIFMGTPEFAVPALDALRAAGHDIVAVYTRPPRPAGRGQKERCSPVHAFAVAQGIPVRTPLSLKNGEEARAFAELGADVAVVAAYGLILPRAILEAPRHGCLNIHASLLPRWRGAAPIQRAILAGDEESGVTIMQMDEGLDTGVILLQEVTPIDARTSAAELHDRLANIGARLIVEALARLATGGLTARPQPANGVTYAVKLGRGEGRLDWSRPAVVLERQVRAYDPWPGAWFEIAGARIKVIKAELAAGNPGAPPGTVLDDRLTIACGTAALRLLEVQAAGRAAMDAGAFLRGRPIAPGTRLS